MKRLFKKHILIFSVLCFLYSGTQATIMGSDLNWTCLGGDSFLIKVNAYADCNGTAMSSITINFKCATTGSTINNLNLSAPTPVDITPVCHTACTRCQSSSCSFQYGINRYLYEGIVHLNNAGSCCNVIMSWSYCCRSTAITTGAAGANFYTYAEMNRCQNPCDNSPTFTNAPVEILCVGQDATYNHGVYDIDTTNSGVLSDSLTYEWSHAMSGAGSNITYTGQYAYNRAIYFWGFPSDALPFPRGFRLDHQTGDIQFRPMLQQVTVMVVQVNEFRNGVKIAEVHRDLQFMVISCTGNNPPSLITPNNVRSKSVCAGSPVSFTFSANDPNSNDTVTISWNNSLPGATWTTSNGYTKHPTATLTWTPSQSQASSLPYTFTVTTRDNACPINAQYTQAYQITVKPIPQANYTVIDTGCGQYCFEAHLIKGSHMIYQWTGSGGINYSSSKFIHQYKSPGTYPFRFSYSSGGCGSAYNDTIRTDTFLWIKLPKDTTICKGTTVNLSAQSYNAIGSLHYQWSTVHGDTMPNRTFRVYSDTSIILWITDQSGCTAKDTMQVKTYLPKVDAGRDTTICLNDVAILRAKGGVKFIWDNGDTTVTTNVKPPYSKFIYVTVTDTNNCPNRDSVYIKVNSLPYVNAGPDTAICWKQIITISVSGGYKYKWNTGETKNYITKMPLYPTHYFVTATDDNNCSSTDTIYVKINPLPVVYAGLDQNICSLRGYQYLYGKPDLNSGTGYWSGMAVFQDSAGFWHFDPNASGINHLGKYPLYYHYSDSNGCINSDTTVMTVFNESPVDAGQYNNQCINGSKMLLSGSPPGGYWKGDAVIDPFFDPVKAGIGIHLVIYFHANSVCPSTDTTYIEVVSLPEVQIGTYNGRTEFCPTQGMVALYGSPAGGPYGGVWSGDVEPYHLFNTTRTEGTYSVIYTFKSEYGCINADTLFLKVSQPKISIETSQKEVCFGKSIFLKAIFNIADSIRWTKAVSSNGYFGNSVRDTEVCYIPGLNDYSNGGLWLKVKTFGGLCNAATDSVYIKTGYYPKTDFSADLLSGYFPLLVNFTDLSTIQSGSITGFNWDFGDGNYSIIQNPVNTFLNAGSYDVKLTIVSDIGCKDSLIKPNYISTTTSLPEDINAEFLRVSPNPANGYIDVSFADKQSEIIQIHIYNASGTLIFHSNSIDQNSARIDIHNFKSGLYLLRVISDKGVEYLAKFVKE